MAHRADPPDGKFLDGSTGACNHLCCRLFLSTNELNGIKEQISITIEPLAVNAATAAQLIGISRSHFLSLEKSGAIGPRPLDCLGGRVLFSVDELRKWVAAGMPRRSEWGKE